MRGAEARTLRLSLRLARGSSEPGLVAHERGQLRAERVDTVFQGVIEHVPDHDHSTLGPLARAAQFGVAELGHGAVADGERAQEGKHGITADAVALRQFVDHSAAFGGQFHHYWRSWPPRARASDSRSRVRAP